jgi:serine/threonine protein kinase
MAKKSSWGLEEGQEIAPGRSVLRLLGGGRSYEVYLVWDDALFAVMVAKLLRPDLAEEERSLRSLRREAQALERLAHPVLLRGFGAVLDGPYPHVLVEHLEGPTLRRLIKRGGPLSLQQVLPLGLQVASALHYMAGQGMVHLDVKPDNVVMGIPPRLIDLSLARSLDRAARLTDWIGTNAYMPPEQCAPGDAGVPGPHSDVWGLAATLYHAAVGSLPFPRPLSTADDATLAQRFPQLTEPPIPFPDALPQGLGAAIMPCLSADPAERPTAAEFAQSLEPLVAALPKKLVLGRRGAIGA